MRSRVASPAARSAARLWARESPCDVRRASWPSDIKICLYLLRGGFKSHRVCGPLSPREFLVFDALGQHGILTEPPLLVLLVVGEIALEPLDVAVPLEGQDVGGDPIQEEAIMADDDRAARE